MTRPTTRTEFTLAVEAARDFPANTCAASRHVETIARALIGGEPVPMLTEEPQHVGESLLAVVTALWEARTEIARLRAAAPSADPAEIRPVEAVLHDAIRAARADSRSTTEAARKLGMGRSTLYRHIKAMGAGA